ncbi:MAG: hypothetical protein ABUT20_08260 [Bacteroidota bacterium]
MMSLWTEIRTIISQHRNSGDLMFSVIDKNGNLYYVNAEMRKVLENHSDKKRLKIFLIMYRQTAEMILNYPCCNAKEQDTGSWRT